MVKQNSICGIDLGTTNSLVAFLAANGKPTSIPNFTGDLLTPSMVYIDEEQVVVGSLAKKVGAQNPSCFAECFKRAMGEDRFPKPLGGRFFRPEELSALVLRRLKVEAQRQLGHAAPAVITVPAYFDEGRRRATKNAGLIAGWEVVDLLNEPTAAAIAYAHHQNEIGQKRTGKERLLVYDLGGGTFDTTILEVHQGREYRTLATEGEVQLGGQDWDEWLCEYLADQFRRKTSCDPRKTEQGRFEFLQLARTIKHKLSSSKTATVPGFFQGRRAVVDITLETFEKGTAHLLARSKQTTGMVLEQAGLKWQDIDKVLLVGGSTRMPMVRGMLYELTGKIPEQSLSPDEAVAHGAAVYAHLLHDPHGPKVINVNSHSYRICCVNRQGQLVAHPLIPKNSPLPKENKLVIPVRRAGAAEAVIKIMEGEADDPKLCVSIGRVRILGLPYDPYKRWLVTIALKCVEDGKLVVNAAVHDPQPPHAVLKEAQATLETVHGMTEAEVHKARQKLEAMEIQ